MYWLFKNFWRSLILAMTFLGVFYLPSDLVSISEASEPWSRLLAMISREVLALFFAALAFAFVFYRDAKPIIFGRFLTAKEDQAVRGGYRARLKLIVDPSSKHLTRVENKNVLRYYWTGGRRGDFLFLAFEKPIGTETISLRHNDGATLLFTVLDRSEGSVVIELGSAINKSGVTFECGNDADLMNRTIGVDQLPLSPLKIEEKRLR